MTKIFTKTFNSCEECPCMFTIGYHQAKCAKTGKMVGKEISEKDIPIECPLEDVETGINEAYDRLHAEDERAKKRLMDDVEQRGMHY